MFCVLRKYTHLGTLKRIVAILVRGGDHRVMGELQSRSLTAAKAFYSAGLAATDKKRRAFFAADFIWHVPGDTDLSHRSAA